MAQEILNLDEILAERPERIIHWRNQDHPLAGLTGAAYLRFLLQRKKLEKAQKDGDEAAQWEMNMEIIGILAPSLANNREDLLALPMATLDKLARFVMSEFSALEAETATAAGPTSEAGKSADVGESISP